MRINFYSTGAVAAQAGVSASTVLLWERRGLIPTAARVTYGTERFDRIYSAADADAIIRYARERGFVQPVERQAA